MHRDGGKHAQRLWTASPAMPLTAPARAQNIGVRS